MLEPEDRPKQIAIEYNYFGDAELRIDEDVVRRIRFDFDPHFVPVFKLEVYKFSSGGTRVYRNFGIGIGHVPGMPITNQDVYNAPKPYLGYLAEIERAMAVAEWWPYQRDPDGTPGETIAFGEWVYSYARYADEEMKRRAALDRRADTDENTLPGVMDAARQMAYKAVTQGIKQELEDRKKAIDSEESHLRDVMHTESDNWRTFFEMTDEDRMGVGSLIKDQNPTNAVHFGPVRPARPGSKIVVPI
jgi:hypothetical protein